MSTEGTLGDEITFEALHCPSALAFPVVSGIASPRKNWRDFDPRFTTLREDSEEKERIEGE